MATETKEVFQTVLTDIKYDEKHYYKKYDKYLLLLLTL